MAKYINRIKAVIAEQPRTNLWLVRELGEAIMTISKRCTNSTQPSLEARTEIASALNVDICFLLNSSELINATEPSKSYAVHE